MGLTTKGKVPTLCSAQRALAHLEMLSAAGVGMASVAAACDVSWMTLKRIRWGRRRYILKETERRILGVTEEAYCEGSHIDAAPTWRLIEELLEEGFTRAELARRLGLKKPELRFSKRFVTGATAVRVEKFYRQLMVC